MLMNTQNLSNNLCDLPKSQGVTDFEKLTGVNFPSFDTFSPLKTNSDPFDIDGWLLATQLATAHKTTANTYLISKEGKTRIAWIQERTGVQKLVRTQTRATWLHPYLAYWFIQHLGINRRTKPVLNRIEQELTKLKGSSQPNTKIHQPRKPEDHKTQRIVAAISLSEAAKRMGLERNALINWLVKNDYIEKQPFTNQIGTCQLWYAKPWAIKDKSLVVIAGKKRGVEFNQTKVTPQGYWQIFEKITAPQSDTGSV